MDTLWVQLLLLVLTTVISISSGKQQVNFGAIVQQNVFMRKKYSSALRIPLRYVRNNPLFANYDLRPDLIELDQWSPPELLDAILDKIIAKNITAIFYLGNTQYVEKNVPSEKYLMKTADFLGVPVIAWVAENSGLFQVCTNTSLVCQS